MADDVRGDRRFQRNTMPAPSTTNTRSSDFGVSPRAPPSCRQARLTTTATPDELGKQRDALQRRNRRVSLVNNIEGIKRGGIIRPTLHWYPNLGPLMAPASSEREELDMDDKALVGEESINDPKFIAQEEEGDDASQSFLAPGSVPAAVINLGTATMGLGSLSLPKATDMAGVAAAMGITVAMYAFVCLSIHLIAACLDAQGVETFAELSVAVGGRKLGICVEFMCMIYCFGTMVSILLGSAKVVGIATPEVSVNLVILYVTLSMLPPLLVENVGALSSISCFSQLCLVYNCLIITAYLFVLGFHDTVLSPIDGATVWEGEWNSELLVLGQARGSAMGYIRASLVFIFAFANQTVVPCIYSELRERSVRNMTRVGCITMAIVTTIYGTVNLAGFLTWGDDCNSNVLFNYRNLLGLRHAFLCLALLTSLMAAWTCFPLNAFPCKFALVALTNYRVPSTFGNAWVGRGVAVFLVLLAFVAAVALPSLSVVLELVGATAGVAVMFMLPGGFYLALVPRSSGELWGPFHMYQLCYLMLICGVAIGSLGTYSAIQDAIAVLMPSGDKA